jgi:hypothetical protein
MNRGLGGWAAWAQVLLLHICRLPGNARGFDLGGALRERLEERGNGMPKAPATQTLATFLEGLKAAPPKGPVALIVAEDDVEVESTVTHHLQAGFADVLLLADDAITLTSDLGPRVRRVRHDVFAEGAMVRAVNALIDSLPGTWIYWGFNAEYLFHPFCETRNVRELIAFHTEERRDAFLSYVIDLYAADLKSNPNAVSHDALLDRSGYYALTRKDAQGRTRERQYDFFGGLRWRFEEHIPEHRRKIDRIALFKAKPGLRLREDYTLSDEEMNTYACPWHNNITTAVLSFRTAKALRTNPGSKWDVTDFRWRNSVPFQWHSQQLMDLGLMEPGQWF